MPKRVEIEEALAKYIAIVSECALATTHADDRPKYTHHLAAAAEMFSEYYRSGSIEKLREIIKRERRAYGWDYLAGPEGERAEGAFNELEAYTGM